LYRLGTAWNLQHLKTHIACNSHKQNRAKVTEWITTQAMNVTLITEQVVASYLQASVEHSLVL
jgi:hypothetical protein